MTVKDENRTSDLELDLLLEAIRRQYGYDFKEYAPASLKRRLTNILGKHRLQSLSELQHRILHDATFFPNVLSELTVTVTEMFRDPAFFKTLRDEVVPYLKTYSSVKVWHAGCSTGHEVYSLRILFEEEDLGQKSVFYATDINPGAIRDAKAGIVKVEHIKDASGAYYESGGRSSLNQYFTVKHGFGLLDEKLRSNLVFSDHNLLTDAPFGEMQLIICRNVLIYFSAAAQERALSLFRRSLGRGGYLCLGPTESLSSSSVATEFEPINAAQRIFRLSDSYRTARG